MAEDIERKRIGEFESRTLQQIKDNGVLIVSIPNSGSFRVSIKDITDAIALVDSAITSHKNNAVAHITNEERNIWNSKYAKPIGGIPMVDLSNEVIAAINAGGSGGGGYDDTQIRQWLESLEDDLTTLTRKVNAIVIPDTTQIVNRIGALENWKSGLVIPDITSLTTKVSALETWKAGLPAYTTQNEFDNFTMITGQQFELLINDLKTVAATIPSIEGLATISSLNLLDSNLRELIEELRETKQTKLVAGAGIMIVDNKISATGEGSGGYDDGPMRELIAEMATSIEAIRTEVQAIEIPDVGGLQRLVNEIATNVDLLDTTLQGKQGLLNDNNAGTGITITNGVISAIQYDDTWVRNILNNLTYDGNKVSLQGAIDALKAADDSIYAVADGARTSAATLTTNLTSLANRVTALEQNPGGGGGSGGGNVVQTIVVTGTQTSPQLVAVSASTTTLVITSAVGNAAIELDIAEWQRVMIIVPYGVNGVRVGLPGAGNAGVYWSNPQNAPSSSGQVQNAGEILRVGSYLKVNYNLSFQALN